MRQNVVAYLALFIALGGTSAYAANTIRSTDIVDGEVKTADVANQDLTGGDVKDGTITTFDVSNLVGDDIIDGTIGNADLSATAGAVPFIGRGHLTCNPTCFAFSFRPQGFTNNAEGAALEDRAFRAPPGGLKVSDLAATLSTTVPGGQAFNMWLIQFSTSNVYLTCNINGGSSTCNSSGSATIGGGELFDVVVNTSYSVPSNPYLDFSFRARPAS
jgi:hypothetical protein